jgi:membrane-associated protease RseP (regulator of RpoE activity)
VRRSLAAILLCACAKATHPHATATPPAPAAPSPAPVPAAPPAVAAYDAELVGCHGETRLAIREDSSIADVVGALQAASCVTIRVTAQIDERRVHLSLPPGQIAVGIHAIDASTWQIARSVVDQVLANPGAIMNDARIVPSIHDGKASGFKLFAMRPGSLWAQLGLQNGDEIDAVNGNDVSDPQKTLDVYAKIKSAKELVVAIVRHGQPVTLTWRIVDHLDAAPLPDTATTYAGVPIGCKQDHLPVEKTAKLHDVVESLVKAGCSGLVAGPLTIGVEDPVTPSQEDAFDAPPPNFKTDETHFTIPGAARDLLVAGGNSGKDARVIPSVSNGTPNGFKVYAIRPSSPFTALGIQNGDTISSINGVSLADPDKALQAYASLKTATSFDVDIIRRGQPVTLHYTVTQ